MKPRTCFVAVYVAFGLAATLHAQADCADWNTGAFFEAAEISDVTRCLQAGADPEAREENGYTPLHVAATFGNAEVIAVLAGAGANLEARDEMGITPLHAAVIPGNAEVIAALLQAGADLEARAESGITPLHVAAITRNAEVIAAIAALLQAGADLEAQAEGGGTPLHAAAARGNAETIEALLQAGANPKALTATGKLPFDLIKDNEQLRGTDGYWKLNQARFE